MKRFKLYWTIVPLVALGITAAALVAAPHPSIAMPAVAATQELQIPIQQFTLTNGLRVVLSEDHAAPTVSVSVTFDVGSRNELPGHTGFAHLFEHMMFQGSENVGKGEHLILVRVNGGDVNGSTGDDSTNYYERVPANQLDMALFLESDRMRALRITQANLVNQRSTVQEERRLRMDNQPYGKTDEVLEDLAYDNFAYKHSTMGSMDDLDAASLADVAQFFKTYYAPDNAVLTLVGDFKTPEALAKIKKSLRSRLHLPWILPNPPRQPNAGRRSKIPSHACLASTSCTRPYQPIHPTGMRSICSATSYSVARLLGFTRYW